MKTVYEFKVDTFRTSEKPVTITTRRVSIEFMPDQSCGNQLMKASVTMDGEDSPGTQNSARLELVKVLAVHFGDQANCHWFPSGWHEIREEGDTKRLKVGAAIQISSNARFVAPYSPSSGKALKINIDGDENLILQFYDASRREHPQDKYLQMFRILEYMCGQRPSKRKMKKHLQRNLGVEWHIPQSALQKAQSIRSLGRIKTAQDLFSELWDLRSRCAHLQPKYGFLSFDDAANSKVREILPIIVETVRHSLEVNPKTKEP